MSACDQQFGSRDSELVHGVRKPSLIGDPGEGSTQIWDPRWNQYLREWWVSIVNRVCSELVREELEHVRTQGLGLSRGLFERVETDALRKFSATT